jgi:raffinose/stachyose/melibiose transport system substrate-binding protein
MLILAACGDGTSTNIAVTTTNANTVANAGNTTNSTATNTATASGVTNQLGTAQVTLKMLIHQNKPLVDYVTKLNSKFQQKYPNVTVDLAVVPTDQLAQSIQTRLSAGDIDLFENTQAFTNAPQAFMKGIDDPTWLQWIKGGLLEDLTNQPFIKNFDSNALKDASSYNGKIYALSTGRYAYSGVFYNKEIFTQNNLQVPTTWSEFVTLCELLKAKGIAPMTAGGKDGWPIGAVGDSGLLLSTFPNQPALVKGLWTGQIKYNDTTAQLYFEKGQKFLSYFEKGVSSVDYQTAPGRFATGKAAMYPAGTWDAPTILQANPNIKLGYFPFPGSDNPTDNKVLAGKYDVAWYVPAKANAKEAALAYLNFFSQTENYSDYVNTVGILPNQPGVSLNTDYAKEIVPYLANFKVAFGEMMLSPKNVGKYASFDLTNFSPFGDVTDSKDLTQKAQADWESALKS